MIDSVYPILALDISTPIAHACLLTSSEHASHAQGKVGQQHSHTVLPLLEGLLHAEHITWNDLNLLVLGKGPGSLTGLRIAAASMAGINASLTLPMWGISSLAITAMQVESDEPVWVIEDARASEVFLGCYCNGVEQQADSCVHIDTLCSHTDDGEARNYICSSDFSIHGEAWQRLEVQYDRAQAMSRLIQTNIQHINIQGLSTEVQPAYLQLSQAERLLKHA